MNKHLEYLKSFGSERLKEYYRLLGRISVDLDINLPYEEGLSLPEYLEKYNLWYTLYL
jgi:hypothetical protein